MTAPATVTSHTAKHSLPYSPLAETFERNVSPKHRGRVRRHRIGGSRCDSAIVVESTNGDGLKVCLDHDRRVR